MERLTKVDGIGQNEIIRCFACDLEKAGEDLEHCGYCEHWQAVLDRLAAYEDTGLGPEEIKKTFNEEAVLQLAAQALGTTPERLRELVKARDGHKAYKLDGFYCDICKKGHMRIVGIDGVYFTRAEAEAALSSRKGETHESN